MSRRTSLAVIIPALNEADTLAALLEDLHRQSAVHLQVIVVDGGSTDSTVDVAREHGAHVVRSSTGRGAQMNAGRRATDARWLLFLHADTRIDDPRLIRVALDAIGPRQCGHFPLRFRTDNPSFRYLEAKTRLNRPYTTNGDQGMLLAAELFDELGGFDGRLPFLEDQRFAETARRSGVSWVTLPGEVSTSARGFEQRGFGARYFSMAVIMAAWAGGADELFDRNPDLYEHDLRRLLEAVRQATIQMGLRRAVRVYLDAAAFARRNAWQLFFAADVALSAELPDGEHPFLDWYDRHLGDEATHRPVLDCVVAIAGFALLNGLLSAA